HAVEIRSHSSRPYMPTQLGEQKSRYLRATHAPGTDKKCRRVDGRKVDRGEEVRTLPLLSQVGVYPSAMSRSDAMGVTTILQLLVRGSNTGAISRSCTNRRVQAARFETKCADFKAGGQRYRRTGAGLGNRRSARNALPACRSGPLQTRHADET